MVNQNSTLFPRIGPSKAAWACQIEQDTGTFILKIALCISIDAIVLLCC